MGRLRDVVVTRLDNDDREAACTRGRTGPCELRTHRRAASTVRQTLWPRSSSFLVGVVAVSELNYRRYRKHRFRFTGRRVQTIPLHRYVPHCPNVHRAFRLVSSCTTRTHARRATPAIGKDSKAKPHDLLHIESPLSPRKPRRSTFLRYWFLGRCSDSCAHDIV